MNIDNLIKFFHKSVLRNLLFNLIVFVIVMFLLFIMWKIFN
jgi:hypothetical protein